MITGRLQVTLTGIVLLLAPHLLKAQAQSQLSAADLVKQVIQNELRPSTGTEIHWRYHLEKEVDGRRETRQVIETQSGSLDRLIAVAGTPLTEAQASDEVGRILRLVHNPAERRKLEQARQKDAEQCNAFLKMVPDAFIFEYAGQSGALTKVTFKPNPRFRPPTREAKVLQQMAGEIWVDAKQSRFASIRGQLMNEVKFAGGLLGHLEKGGEFSVRRSEVAAGDWELTEMTVNMRGKALLFKTICVQQKELHNNFERVPDNLSLADAANLLLHQSLVAFKQ